MIYDKHLPARNSYREIGTTALYLLPTAKSKDFGLSCGFYRSCAHLAQKWRSTGIFWPSIFQRPLVYSRKSDSVLAPAPADSHRWACDRSISRSTFRWVCSRCHGFMLYQAALPIIYDDLCQPAWRLGLAVVCGAGR